MTRLDRLRVFLTDPSKFTHPGHFGSHALVNDFSSLEHLLSACILSSYVPVGTGPMIPEPGSTVDKAFKFMEDKWVKRMKKGGEKTNEKRSDVRDFESPLRGVDNTLH